MAICSTTKARLVAENERILSDVTTHVSFEIDAELSHGCDMLISEKRHFFGEPHGRHGS
jgi:hypothetical protein